VLHYAVVKDSIEEIQSTVKAFLSDSDCVIISGGTGITRNDVTVDAVRKIADFEITGFSVVFTIKSFNEVGTSALLSRATAFAVGRKPVFCLPGSPRAAVMGTEEIIIPEIDHIIHELAR
ncbi:MAG: molybdopterin-binding protein, partial [Thermoplasmataceae archaeon]